MTKYSTLANELYPYLLPKLQKSGRNGNGGSGGGGATLLSQLGDVQLTSLADGDFLAYEASIAKWINVDAPTGGGGGGSYTAGWGINIDGSDVISVDVPEITDLNSGLEVVSNKIAVNLQTSSGLVANSSGLALDSNLAGNGLDMTAGKIMSVLPKTMGGLDVDATGVFVLKPAISGLEIDSTGVRIRRRGLNFSESGLSMTSDGIYLADTVAGNGLEWTDATNRFLRINLAFNFSWMGTHAHAALSTFNGGATFNAGAFRFNTDPQINANLDFIGATLRTITAASHLTIMPTGDLTLDPTGLILLPTAQELKTSTFNDFVAGIAGLRHWDTGGNVRQLTIGKLKADELHVRVFSADEQRVSRGAQFWAYSFGIVETTFTLPADEANVDVWFEEAPDLGSFKLFVPGDWILFRTIDADTGLIVQKVWFQVFDTGVDDWVTREDASDGPPAHVSRQQWRLKRESGGTTGMEIKKGSVGVDFGKPFSVTNPIPGQGVVHLSALHEDGGPFIQIQTFETIASDIPVFENRVRMGNLSGTVDYSTDIYGFAAGNDLSVAPSAGFSGLVADATNGLRLFNTDLEIYNGGVKTVRLDRNKGLIFRHDVEAPSNLDRQINWFDDIDVTEFVPRTTITSYGYDDDGLLTRQLYMFVTGFTGEESNEQMRLQVINNDIESFASLFMETRGVLSTGAIGAIVYLGADEIGIGSKLLVGGDLDETDSIAKLHVVENTTAINQLAGLVIEQKSTGDAVIHWRLTTPNRYYTMGIDNNDADKFKISASTSLGTSDFFVYDPVTGLVTVSGLTGGGGGGGGTYTAGSGINITGLEIAVDSTVVRTDYVLTTGDGLLGGGNFSANRTISVGAGAGISVNPDSVSVALVANSGLSTVGGLGIAASFAGDGLVITSGVLDIVPLSTGGLAVGANEIHIKLRSAASGLQTDSDGLWIHRKGETGLASGIALHVTDGIYLADTVAGAGLEWTTSTERILQVSLGGGLEFNDATVDATVRVKLPADSGLVRDGTGIYLDPLVAGAGLAYTPGVISVGEGNGITVGTNAVTIKLRTVSPGSGMRLDADGLSIQRRGSLGSTSGIGMNVTDGMFLADSVAGAGLEWSSATDRFLQISIGSGLEFSDATVDANLRIKLPTNSGLVRDTTGLYLDDALAGQGLIMNASKQLNVIAANTSITVTADDIRVNTAHNFPWTGNHTFGSAALFRVDSIAQFNEDINFMGVARTITSAASLTIAPTGNLILDATGDLARSTSFSDLVTGISGFRMWDRGANYIQLTMGAIKIDELYARVFVADEVRIDRGEEYWSKSYGVIETDFVLPADEANVDVWFENSPGLAAANLFSVGDWLLLRAIDWGTSLAIYKVWFTVVALVTGGGVDGYRQRWTIKREIGGTLGLTVKKGGVMLDAGQIGQGWIHLSALAQDGGPFIQIGDYTSLVGDTPQFTNRVRMGNLSGAAGISGTFWGFAAGNDLSLDASLGGFSGFTVGKGIGSPGTNYDGLRIYNTDIQVNNAGVQELLIPSDGGIRILQGGATFSERNALAWYSDVNDTNTLFSTIHSQTNASGNHSLVISNTYTVSDVTGVYIRSIGPSGQANIDLISNETEAYVDIVGPSFIRFNTSRMAVGNISPVSVLHVYENTTSTGATTGLTVEQDGAGDAAMQFYLTGGQYWSLGIDNSVAGDPLRIAPTADLSSGPVFLLTTAGALTLTDAIRSDVRFIAPEIRALSSAGLRIEDDSGNLGMFVEDTTGHVGFGHAAPVVPIHLIGSGVGGGDTNQTIIRAENTAAGGAAAFHANNDAGVRIQFVMFGSTFTGTNFNVNRTNAAMFTSNSTLGPMCIGPTVAQDLIFGTNDTRRMTISSTGLIGIGVPSPVAQLDIVGGTTEDLRLTSAAEVRIVMRRSLGTPGSPSQVTTGTSMALIGAQGYTSSGWPAVGEYSASIEMEATQNHTSTARGTSIEFRTTANGAASSTYRLLIGQDGLLYYPGGYFNTVSVVPNMSIASDGSFVRTTHANSSLRYKEDVQAIEPDTYEGLFDSLRPVSYRLKPDYGGNVPGARRKVGLIAEEVEAAGGELFIQYDQQGRPDVLMYDRLIVVLIAEMRRYKAEKDNDRKRIVWLEQEVYGLKKRMSIWEGGI